MHRGQCEIPPIAVLQGHGCLVGQGLEQTQIVLAEGRALGQPGKRGDIVGRFRCGPGVRQLPAQSSLLCPVAGGPGDHREDFAQRSVFDI